MIETIIGMGLVAFLFLFLVYIIKDLNEHFALRLLFIFFSMFIILLIPIVTLNNNDYCVMEVNESTTINNITTYDYDRFCVDNENNTEQIFYYIVITIIGLFYIYMLLYFLGKVVLFDFLRKMGIMKREYKK